MKVFVTGANGLLATNTIKYLLEDGHIVTGYLRDASKFVLKPHRNLKLKIGDIEDKIRLAEAMQGCDTVIHAAALTSPDLLSYTPYRKINVVGTQNVLEAALATQISTFLYVSSANTIGHGTQNEPGYEGKPVQEPFIDGLYAKSKKEGEELVLKMAHKMRVLVVNPTFMLGTYDTKPSSGQIILMGYNKRMVFAPPGGKNFVNVKDVAHGILKALHTGKNKETYLLAGENLSYLQFFLKLKSYSERKPVIMVLPKSLLIVAGFVGSQLRKIGVNTGASSTNMKIICTKNFYTNEKARTALNTSFNPIESGIEDAIHWFKETGLLK